MKSMFPVATALALLTARPSLAADAPSYTKDVKPFLAKYCVECHNDTKAKAGVILDSYAALTKPTRRGPAVTPNKPEKSRLVATLTGSGKQMPPRKSTQPKASEIDMIKAWITAGAKDDSETAPADKDARKESSPGVKEEE
jgi:hypothetical protein